MKKIIYCKILFLLFSCGNKNKQYSKELEQIFNTHGGLKAWKNVRTITFDIDDKSVTLDLESGKKVINTTSFSIGFDGKDYWKSDNSIIKNPEEYLKKLANVVLIPFSLADKKQTGFNKDSTVLTFDDVQIFYNPDFYNVDQVKISGKEINYIEWQEVIGFKLPKKVKTTNEEIEFKNLQLSQATFDDRFYQKLN